MTFVEKIKELPKEVRMYCGKIATMVARITEATPNQERWTFETIIPDSLSKHLDHIDLYLSMSDLFSFDKLSIEHEGGGRHSLNLEWSSKKMADIPVERLLEASL